MAVVDYRSASGTNLVETNFNNILINAFDFDFFNGSDPVFHPVVTDYSFTDIYSLFFTDGSNFRAFAFYGDGLVVGTDGSVILGTVTAFVEFIWDGFDYQPIGGALDFEINAPSVASAFSSQTVDDDFAIYELAFSGEDLGLMSDGQDVFGFYAGDDIAFGYGGDDALSGGAGDDILRGGIGNDTLHGDDGVDVLRGGSGDDSLFGGSGGSASDRQIVTGDRGEDTVEGGSGADTARGGADDDVVSGNGGDDIVSGDAGDDTVSGGAGDDIIRGGAGDDNMTGGAGDDRMVGDRGNDIIAGGDGADTLIGAAGSDTLNGGNGDDLLSGGSDADRFVFSGGDDVVRDFVIGVDTLDVSLFPAFSSFDDVLAATTELANGIRIDLSDSASVIVREINADQLTESDFVFG